MSAQRKGGSAKKYGRNAKWCEAYRSRNQRLTNKIAKVKRHIKRFPKDDKARGWLREHFTGARDWIRSNT